MSTVRLDRLLSNLGYGSRREIGEMASAGRIALNGAPIRDASRRMPVSRDLPEHLSVAGHPLDPMPGLVILMHKALGATCSHKESGELVYEQLPLRWRRRDPAISTIGRLDKDTSGLLLLTDDGDFLHRVISPKAKIEKRYLVGLARPLSGEEARIFEKGTLMLEGEDRPLLPAHLEVLGEKSAALTITEGRYHQVRRMFAAVGNHVETLHRDRVGGLTLHADLAPGEWRLLGEAEAQSVFA